MTNNNNIGNDATTTTMMEDNHPPPRRKSIVILFAFAYACCIVSYSQVILLTASSLVGGMSGGGGGLESESEQDENDPRRLFSYYSNDNNPPPNYPFDEAQYIIQKSYAESYARMFPCSDDLKEKVCIEEVVRHLHSENNSTTTTTTTQQQQQQSSQPSYFQVPPSHPYPWWFRTLLRDIPTNGAYGFWHHFSTISTHPDTPIRFCAIGKNGSSEWRKVFRLLNAPEFCKPNDEKAKNNACSKFNTHTELKEDVARTVFLRDPLERLLSGYLDKCYKGNVRRGQGHCTPNEVFGVDFLEGRNRRGQREGPLPPDVTDLVQDMDKEMFATYVDLLPLQWNVHFVPQALFCDLYRTINDYDFVGYMGKNFMYELERMAVRYGGLLPTALEEYFRYQSKLANESGAVENVGSDKQHGTKAPAKVAQFYSARALRRALEYLSIDYVALGLDVPEWAREMLRNDAAA